VAQIASGRTFATKYWAVEVQLVNYFFFVICTAMYHRYAV